MNATEILKQEHQYILKALDNAKKEIESIEKKGEVDINKVDQIINFIRDFADKWHHEKQEKLLFDKMKEKGLDRNLDPIPFMIEEHEEGRKYVQNMLSVMQNKTCESDCLKIIKDNLQGYRNLLTVHINKEDMYLYPVAEKLLCPDDLKQLEAKFKELENSSEAKQLHQKYDNLLH